MAIQVIDSKNFVEGLFQMWILALPDIRIEGEVKRTLMAFTAILTVEPSNQNKTIIENISTIIAQILKLAEGIDVKKQKKLASSQTKVDYEEDEHEEAEDARETELNDFLKKAKNITSLNDFKAPDEDDGDDDLFEEDDEEDEDWDDFSNLTNITPLDKLDETLYIQQAFAHINQTNVAYYQDLMKLIDDASKIKLETFITNAQARNALSQTQTENK